MPAATALIQARVARPEMAADAVRMAMDKAGVDHPQGVLLYLSSEFARDPRPALSAAARAANCIQIAGCTAAGLLTEEDWVLDTPAAAALVLGGGPRLEAPQGDRPMLTLAAPTALDWHWLTQGGPRYGGVSGDATGQGPYQVWCNGRVQAAGRCEQAFGGVHTRVGVSLGVRPLCHPAPLTAVEGHDILAVDGQPALSSLLHELPEAEWGTDALPVHLLMLGVAYGAPFRAVREGRYHLLPVLSANTAEDTITVAAEVPAGSQVFWALRQPQAAEQDMGAMLERIAADDSKAPDFALMFPCMGRGPWFYGGEERDLQQFTRRFPGTPLIGFYGNGEIAHLDGANRLLQYGTVLALCYDDHVPT